MSNIEKILDEYNISLTAEELDKFEKFLKIFTEKNSQINLSAIRKEDDIIHKHFADSLFASVFVDLHGLVADLGTGGGFPLIPLAITNPDVDFVGIDSVGKKIRCVDEFVSELGLENVSTINGRAEEVGHSSYRENFDFVVSRATAYFPTLIEYVMPLLKKGGFFLAYKLDDKEELKSAKQALHRIGGKISVVKNYKILDQKRTIVIIEKVSPTHKKYPRPNGIPLKEPIK